MVIRQVSKAHWGHSAHNANAALDVFEMGGVSPTNIYETDWFNKMIKSNLPSWSCWYGAIGAPYPELPHIEVAEWRSLLHQGVLKLVE